MHCNFDYSAACYSTATYSCAICCSHSRKLFYSVLYLNFLSSMACLVYTLCVPPGLSGSTPQSMGVESSSSPGSNTPMVSSLARWSAPREKRFLLLDFDFVKVKTLMMDVIYVWFFDFGWVLSSRRRNLDYISCLCSNLRYRSINCC